MELFIGGNILFQEVMIFFAFFGNENQKLPFSNNSTITKDQYVDKLKMDIYAIKDEIISSSSITAYYIAKENPQSKVFCIGEEGIRDELKKNGIKIIDDSSREKVDLVIVGMDRHFNFDKLTKAMRHVLNGAQLYGTNPDLTYPMEDGLIPGCGAILATLKPVQIPKPKYLENHDQNQSNFC